MSKNTEKNPTKILTYQLRLKRNGSYDSNAMAFDFYRSKSIGRKHFFRNYSKQKA